MSTFSAPFRLTKRSVVELEEPATGLHFAGIQRLVECLNQLMEHGHSVVVIEHTLDVIKTADHVIDLGPEGGHNGGRLLLRTRQRSSSFQCGRPPSQ